MAASVALTVRAPFVWTVLSSEMIASTVARTRFTEPDRPTPTPVEPSGLPLAIDRATAPAAATIWRLSSDRSARAPVAVTMLSVIRAATVPLK